MTDDARNAPNHRHTPPLRALAKGRLAERGPLTLANIAALAPTEIQAIFQELQIHQVELELQNEQLRETQLELEQARGRYLDLYEWAPVGYCTICAKGLILEANQTMAELLGIKRAALLGRPLSRFVHKEDKIADYRYRHLADTSPTAIELRMVKADATIFWARLEARAAEHEEAGPVVRVTISDISAILHDRDDLRPLPDPILLVTSRDVSHNAGGQCPFPGCQSGHGPSLRGPVKVRIIGDPGQ